MTAVTPAKRKRLQQAARPLDRLFREGEVFPLRGVWFRVARVDARKIILRPHKGETG